MQPFAYPRKEFSCVSVKATGINVEGINPLFIFVISLIFSFDGEIVKNHANSTNGHLYTTLGTYKESPLAVGGYVERTGAWIPHAEIYNNATNTWNSIADYPFRTE